MKSSVLVTGYNGFTGQYVSNALRADNYEVYGLGFGDCLDANYTSVDLCDSTNLMKIVNEIQPDYVIHLAAKAFIAGKDITSFYDTNLIGTRNLLEALCALSNKPQHIIIASSANIYGNTKEGLLDELEPPKPANDYAVSKIAMEYIAGLYKQRLPISITRPFNYTGAGQHPNFVIPKIIEHFKTKKHSIELGNINVWREFNDVRFVAEVYKNLLQVEPGSTVNICTGKYYSLSQVIEICASLADHRIEIIENPEFVRENEVKVLAGNAEKLKSLIVEDKSYSIEETLSWMLSN